MTPGLRYELAADLYRAADELRALDAEVAPLTALRVIRRLLRTVCRVVGELDTDADTPLTPTKRDD